MAWNGSGGSATVVRTPKKSGNKSLLWVLPILAVVGVGVCVVFWPQTSQDNAGESRVEAPKGRIVDSTTPVFVPEPQKIVEKTPEEIKADRYHKAQKYWADKLYTDTNGVVRYPGGARYMDPTDKIHADKTVKEPPRFKRVSSSQIATLIEMIPGEIPVGGMQFRDNFTQDFVESLDEEIEILDTDSDYDKELKREVAETKKDLAERMKNGEDPKKVCEETWNEMMQLGLYRDELVAQVAEIRKNPDLTANDVQDLVDAANKMLKEKGIQGIGISPLQLRRLAERDRARLENL